ncbi:MAG: hypothetical protein JXB50_10790, partial [Spirochaetes bacterium]|nr:hypothetical protein [Spirochaetota bacterium]
MIEIRNKLINKEYVHKTNDENVLIYNMRRALPVKIDKNIFSNLIIPSLDTEGKELIKKYYILHNKYLDEPMYYMMYNIPHMIAVDYIKYLIIDEKITKSELKILSKYYKKDNEKKHYVLINNITEIDEIQILKVLKRKDIQIYDFDNREKIANIFEKIDNLEKDDIFFANMFADQEHSFFFEHSIEHVPAMMIIEASRQFLLAICHIYGKIPVSGITFILNTIQINFLNYIELNFPIKMIAKINKVKKRRDGTWKHDIDATVSVYQNNIQCVDINYQGRIISSELFRILRNNNINHNIKPRFIPSGMYYKNVSLKDNINNRKYLSKIIDISDTGFQLEVNLNLIETNNKIFDFNIFFQELGFIQGKCELKWYSK